MQAYDSTNSELNSERGDMASFDLEDDFFSVTSDESEISATNLATDIDYAVRWEILNGCQEAAFSDIPSKYQHCLSIFNTQDSCFEGTQKEASFDERYDTLFEAAGATKTSSEPWSLPCPVRPLSDEDALWRHNVRVLEVSQVHPTAAIYLALDDAGVDADNFPDHTCRGGHPMTTSGAFEKSMSPLVHATAPCFASAVFISASHTFPHNKNISFQSLRRYSRLATTSLLRMAHGLQLDTPVFGVLLRGNLVAVHVDWCEEHNGVVESFSAFYPCDDEETDIKTWDLSHPQEEQEVVAILSNLRNYTYGQFASQIRHQVGSVKNPIKPWRWDSSCLSQALSPAQLGQHSEEPSEDKINRWQKSLMMSEDQVTRVRRTQSAQPVRQGKEFLSPPSTPGDVDRLRGI